MKPMISTDLSKLWQAGRALKDPHPPTPSPNLRQFCPNAFGHLSGGSAGEGEPERKAKSLAPSPTLGEGWGEGLSMLSLKFLSVGRKHPIYLFWAVLLNLVLSSTVLAATNNVFTPYQATALVLLILLAIVLSGYLFVVMFQPERF
jgi:K+-transporting ATPase KdpF subunit